MSACVQDQLEVYGSGLWQGWTLQDKVDDSVRLFSAEGTCVTVPGTCRGGCHQRVALDEEESLDSSILDGERACQVIPHRVESVCPGVGDVQVPQHRF